MPSFRPRAVHPVKRHHSRPRKTSFRDDEATLSLAAVDVAVANVHVHDASEEPLAAYSVPLSLGKQRLTMSSPPAYSHASELNSLGDEYLHRQGNG